MYAYTPAYAPRTPPSGSSFAASPSYPSHTSARPSTPVVQAQPITRSRTLFYLSIRDSSASVASSSRRRRTGVGGSGTRQYGETVDVGEDEEERLIGGVGEGGGRGLPPRWVDTSDEVEDVLRRIQPKITALDKLHAKHVLPGFTDRTAEEREIERQTSDITRDFRRCTNLISSITPSPRSSHAEVTTARNVQRGLASKVQEQSGMFRKKQRVYMQKLQGHAIKSKDLLIASGAIPLRSTDMLDDLADDEISSQPMSQSHSRSQSQTQSQAVVAVDLDVETRTKEITQIASSISELAELFRDLGNMVVEQGTVLDSVEYNVGVTAREMKGAVEELKVAQRYQANTGRRKCILLLVLLIVGMVIVLIYKPRGSEMAPPPPPPPPSAPSDGGPPQPLPEGEEWRPMPGGQAVPGQTEPGGIADAVVAGASPWFRPPSVPRPGGEGELEEPTPIGDDEMRRDISARRGRRDASWEWPNMGWLEQR